MSHDYRSFENMVAHAIFRSSRRNGVQGIAFDDVLLACLVSFKMSSGSDNQPQND